MSQTVFLRKPSTEITKRYQSVFVLDRTKLSRILAVCEQSYKEEGVQFTTSFSVTLKDGTQLVLGSYDEVTALDNTVRNPIISLRIMFNTIGKSYSSIEYGFLSNRGSVLLWVEGTKERWANQHFSALDEQIDRTLDPSWSSRITSVFQEPLGVAVYFVVGLLLYASLSMLPGPNQTLRVASELGFSENDIAALLSDSSSVVTTEEKINFIFEMHLRQLTNLSSPPTNPAINFLQQTDMFTLFFLIGLPLLIFGVIVYTIFACYPPAVFAWGDYEEHYNKLVARRNFLWSVVIISFVVSVVGSLFVSAFLSL
jgi:hypothetical protein